MVGAAKPATSPLNTLVLSHLIPAIDTNSDETWRAPAEKYFKGEVIVGKDLMVVRRLLGAHVV
jgi:ribonuclease BN (tRNA processing enzyme)